MVTLSHRLPEAVHEARGRSILPDAPISFLSGDLKPLARPPVANWGNTSIFGWERGYDPVERTFSSSSLMKLAVEDPKTAGEQLELVKLLPLLEITPETWTIAKKLIKPGPLPPNAALDVLHIAISSVHDGLHLDLELQAYREHFHPKGYCQGFAVGGINMWKDRIVEINRRFRDTRAKEFDFDLEAICRDAKKREGEEKRKVIPLRDKKKTIVA